MSDEELTTILENSDEVTSDDPTPSDTKSYCSISDVTLLFGNISDDVTDEVVSRAIANSTAWIEANLKRNYVPIPTKNVAALNTVAVYHSASDIYLSLSQGEDDFLTQYDTWFNKAQTLLDEYIEAYLNSEADESDLVEHQIVKHSHALTYQQKKANRSRRRGPFGWQR